MKSKVIKEDVPDTEGWMEYASNAFFHLNNNHEEDKEDKGWSFGSLLGNKMDNKDGLMNLALNAASVHHILNLEYDQTSKLDLQNDIKFVIM